MYKWHEKGGGWELAVAQSIFPLCTKKTLSDSFSQKQMGPKARKASTLENSHIIHEGEYERDECVLLDDV